MKQNIFYDFEFPVLKYPLRNQKKIVQYALGIQNSGENVKSGYYNNVATSFELDIPSNLADGSQVITIDGGMTLLLMGENSIDARIFFSSKTVL